MGGGVFDKSVSERDEADLIPDEVTWIKTRAASFEPDDNTVVLEDGRRITYGRLVVAAGIQLDWDRVEGLKDSVGKGGVCSNYSFDTVSSTWDAIRDFKGGNAIFTFPSTPINCAGAPQKIMWLAEHHFQRTGHRDKANVIYGNTGAGIFGIPRYAKALNKLVDARGIDARHRNDLIALRPAKQLAVFRQLDNNTDVEVPYDLIHVTPPQSAPDFIEKSPLANEAGWVDVDKYTTQHTRYENVFPWGIAAACPAARPAPPCASRPPSS